MSTIPISTLSPSSPPPSSSSINAVVTLLWPYSSATKQCALLLADPDFRQRYHKGQIRVRFQGPSAHAIAQSGLGIGTAVQLGLDGAQWVTDALTKTPGRSVEGELVFNRHLRLRVQKAGQEVLVLELDEQTPPPPSPSKRPAELKTPETRAPPRRSLGDHTGAVGIYSSPAFMKRLRLSESSSVESPYSALLESDDLDDGTARKRRRVSYKNVTEWKFTEDADLPTEKSKAVTAVIDSNNTIASVVEITGAVTGGSGTEKAAEDVGELVEQGTALTRDDSILNHATGVPAEQDVVMLDFPEIIAETAISRTEHIRPAAGAAVETTDLQIEPEATKALSGAVSKERHKDDHGSAAIEVSLLEQPDTTSPVGNVQPVTTPKISAIADESGPQGLASSKGSDQTKTHMAPPALPRLQVLTTTSAPSSENAASLESNETGEEAQNPNTPRLQPVSASTLPFPSPFPAIGAEPTPLTSALKQNRDGFIKAHSDDPVKRKLRFSFGPPEAYEEETILKDVTPAQEARTLGQVRTPIQVSEKPDQISQANDMKHEQGTPPAAEKTIAVDGPEHPQMAAHSGTFEQSPSPGSEADVSETDYDEDEIIGLQESQSERSTPEENKYTLDAEDLYSRDEIDERELLVSEDEAQELDDPDRLMHTDDEASSESVIELSDDDSGDLEVIGLATGNQGRDDAILIPESESGESEYSSESEDLPIPHLQERYAFGLDGSIFSREVDALNAHDAALPRPDEPTPVADMDVEEHGQVSSQDEEAAWNARDVAVRAMSQDLHAPTERTTKLPVTSVLQPLLESAEPVRGVMADAVRDLRRNDNVFASVSANHEALESNIEAPELAAGQTAGPANVSVGKNAEEDEFMSDADEAQASDEAMSDVEEMVNVPATTPVPSNLEEPTTSDILDAGAATFDEIQMSPPSQRMREALEEEQRLSDEETSSLTKEAHSPDDEMDDDSGEESDAIQSASRVALGSPEVEVASPLRQEDPSQAEDAQFWSQVVESARESPSHQSPAEAPEAPHLTQIPDSVDSTAPIVIEDDEHTVQGLSGDGKSLDGNEAAASVDDEMAHAPPVSDAVPDVKFTASTDESTLTQQVLEELAQMQKMPSVAYGHSKILTDRGDAEVKEESPSTMTHDVIATLSPGHDNVRTVQKPLPTAENDGFSTAQTQQDMHSAAPIETLMAASPLKSGPEERSRKASEVAIEVATDEERDQVTPLKPSLGNVTEVPATLPRVSKGTATRRKSARLSYVPEVISEWFAPRKTRAASKELSNSPSKAASPPKASSRRQSPTKVVAIEDSPARSTRSRRQQSVQRTISPPALSTRSGSQGISTSLAYFTPLTNLDPYVNNSAATIDIIAVAASASSTPTRAKAGPRDWLTVFHITDPVLYEQQTATVRAHSSIEQLAEDDEHSNDDATPLRHGVLVEVFRPWKASLPTAAPGDIVLLRGFVVKSRQHRLYLLSCDASAWCVWRHAVFDSVPDAGVAGDAPTKPRGARARRGSVREEVKGPPVDVGLQERETVAGYRTWWEGLQGRLEPGAEA